jgi:hypothetical protein
MLALILSLVACGLGILSVYWHWHDRYHRDTHHETIADKVTTKMHEEVIPALVDKLAAGDDDGEV